MLIGSQRHGGVRAAGHVPKRAFMLRPHLTEPLASVGPASIDSAPLTPREREIAELIAEGLSNERIAERLVLTPGTVANHVAHILDKLGVQSRVQVAVTIA